MATLTNGDIYKMLCFLSNKEGLGGYIRVEDLNLMLKTQPIVLLREKLGVTNDFSLGYSASRRQKGQSTLLDDQTNTFKKKTTLSFTAGIATLPEDYFRYDSIRTATSIEGVEVLFGGEVASRLNDPIDTPDVEFPISEFMENKVYVYPTTITTADLVYYRYPNYLTPAIFDYYIDVYGSITYLAPGATHTLGAGEVGSAGQISGIVTGSSVELEGTQEFVLDTAFLIAKNLGINLQRSDLYQAMDAANKGGK